MADLPFWFHPDATAEALAIHDHYFKVAANLAEIRLLCEKHGIGIDERYVWD